MDEILQKLLSSELLSEEAKAEISAQWTAAVERYKQALREEVTMAVRGELVERWAKERDDLIDGLDRFIELKLQEEITELKGDIERFRDLEAEYAEKLVEEKHAMAEQLGQELDKLIDKIDAFFELRLTEEFNELKEDLEVVKQNDFGRRLFEAFATEYSNSFIDEDSVQAKLAAVTEKLSDAERTIARLEEANARMVREAKLKEILAPLSGKKREQMEFVLANVETDRLDEAYRHFIGRILRDEGVSETKQEAKAKVLSESKTVMVTGEETASAEAADRAAKAGDKFAHLKRLAGI